MNLKRSAAAFKFADGTFQSLGKAPIRIPTTHQTFIQLEVDVVKPDVPLLIGIDVLDRESLVADNVNNILESRIYGWTVPIIRKHGHMYIEWKPSKTLFTRAELVKLHRHFHHPSTGKILALLKRSKLSDVDSNTKRMLEDISKNCTRCQTYAAKPERFKVSLPNDKVIFNREISLDLMWLDKKAVLHIADTDTHFSSATFLTGQTVEKVWEAFINCWTTLYTGFP